MKPAKHVTWYVEMQGVTLCVTLCGRHGNLRASIAYPHAGLWALIAHGNYSPARATEMMSVLMSIDRRQAESEVTDTLEAWRRAGLVCED
jgi:hypothetical protein